MNPPELKGLTNLESFLVWAIGLLCASNAALFWQLMRAQTRETDAYKVCSPLVAKLTDLCEKLLKGGDR